MGGASEVIRQFHRFVRQLLDGHPDADWADVFVVAIDANCKGWRKKEAEIRKQVVGTALEDLLVPCVPVPHIERWYLLDPRALQKAVGIPVAVPQIKKKCERDYYKRVLANALAPSKSLLTGAEYGAEIAQEVNLDVLADKRYGDVGFAKFLAALRTALARLRTEERG